jgi:outer membrane receptor protein involved in Fe transport
LVNKTSVTAGTEVEYGGFATKYLAPDNQASELTSGSGDRLKLGLYAEGRQRFKERWNVFAGLRLDVLEVGREDGIDSNSSYAEWSPRVGANFAYSQTADRPGHTYLSLSRSFKAPTLDQLYDVRVFPAGEGVISISNPGLQPQTSTSIEAGILQRFPLWKDAFAEMDLAVYRLRVDDEIDFDISTFRFGNIQESRHDGLELSLTARLAPWISLRHASTFVRVVIRSGDLEGNGLKNIPRRNVATALNLTVTRAIEFSLTHRHTGGLYLDDENSHEIQGYHRFGARANWKLGSTSVFMSVNNLFDTRASSLGFLSFDPASGQMVPFVYPIGGRALRMGISLAGE